MRKLTKSIVGACAAVTVLSSIAVVAHAYQATTGWGTHIDFWTDTLSTGVTEKDSDTVSHVTWSGREANYNFKLKFTVQSADNVDVCDQIYVDSATQLGKVVTIAIQTVLRIESTTWYLLVRTCSMQQFIVPEIGSHNCIYLSAVKVA